MTCDYARFGGRLTRGGDVGFATRVGPKVQTVLGLSMTSTSVGWVLLDGQGPDAATLDHDAFDVQSGADDTADDTSRHAAAACGAQAIATASGHKVGSVQVTWTEDAEADAATLLKSLADLGFDNVHAISLSKAAQAWGVEIGREKEHTKTGLCILEPDAATVMIVATGAGSVRTAVTDTRETAEDLIDWLRTVFRRDEKNWLPESLYLLGALADLYEILKPIADALPIPVTDSVDTQLALARGAALATVSQVDGGSSQSAETPRERPWRVSRGKKVTTPAAETVATATVGQVDAGSSQAAETPRERPWLVSHAKELTISAAAVAVFGAALSLAAGSALDVENASTQAANTAASDASVPSASVETVPAPVSARQAPPVQPLAAEPPPVPPAPPETLALPAKPVAAEMAEPVAVPQHTVSALPPANVSAAAPPGPPPMAPLGALPGPPPMAPLGALPGPPPMAPLGALPGPPPMAPLGALPGPPPMTPLGALPGPPPMTPLGAPPGPPPAAAPVLPEPADPPPPPDPIQDAPSQLFSGLP
jgi:hypothetical protein